MYFSSLFILFAIKNLHPLRHDSIDVKTLQTVFPGLLAHFLSDVIMLNKIENVLHEDLGIVIFR